MAPAISHSASLQLVKKAGNFQYLGDKDTENYNTDDYLSSNLKHIQLVPARGSKDSQHRP